MTKRKFGFFAVCSPWILAGFNTASAASKDVEEVSVTAYRTPILQSEIIGNHAAISEEALDLRSPTHIQQVLARVPGVNLHHNSGQEYLPAIRSPVLSGAGACGSFLMAEDGIPLRPAGFCNVNELFEAHSEQASRVEVIRGPSAAFYGSNALHGVINVITPDAGSSDNKLALELGSENFERIKLSQVFGDLAVAFTGTRDRGFRDASGVDQQKLSLRGGHNFGGVVMDAGATLINLNQETAGYIYGFESYKDDDIAQTNTNPEAHRDAQAVRVWSRFADKEASPSWVITPYARYSDMDFLMHFLPGTPMEENGQKSVGVQSALYRYGDNHRLIVGLDGEVVDGWLQQYQLNPTEGSPFVEATIPTGFHYDYEVLAFQLSPFLQWDYAIDEHWDLSLGVRYEWMQYDYDNLMVDGRTRDDGTSCGFGGCRYSRPPDSTDSFDSFSPKLGLSYSPSVDQRVYLTLGRGFRAPQAVELYRLQRAQTVADLDSEQLDSAELGFQGKIDKWRYEVVLYTMKKRNLIFRDSDFFNVSSGRTTHTGVEYALAYQFSDAFSVALAGTEARHEYDYDYVSGGLNINGNDVDSAPRRFGSLTAKWATQQMGVEVEWLHMGSYFTDPENVHRYEGHELFNLLGYLNFSPSIRFNARVINLLDENYADRADFTTFSGDRYIPGAPRSFFAGVTYVW